MASSGNSGSEVIEGSSAAIAWSMEEAWSALADGTMPIEMVVAKAMVTAAENHEQDVGYRMPHPPIR